MDLINYTVLPMKLQFSIKSLVLPNKNDTKLAPIEDVKSMVDFTESIAQRYFHPEATSEMVAKRINSIITKKQKEDIDKSTREEFKSAVPDMIKKLEKLNDLDIKRLMKKNSKHIPTLPIKTEIGCLVVKPISIKIQNDKRNMHNILSSRVRPKVRFRVGATSIKIPINPQTYEINSKRREFPVNAEDNKKLIVEVNIAKHLHTQEVDFSELPALEAADMLLLFPTTKDAPPIQLNLSLSWIQKPIN